MTCTIHRVGLTFLWLGLSMAAGVSASDVVAVVSVNNPVTTLNRNQVVDIFLGKTVRFPDGSPVVPIDQMEGSTGRNEFYLEYAGMTTAQLKAHWSKIIFTGRGFPPEQVVNCLEVKQYLLEHPDAIGYIERDLVDDSVKVVFPLESL